MNSADHILFSQTSKGSVRLLRSKGNRQQYLHLALYHTLASFASTPLVLIRAFLRVSAHPSSFRGSTAAHHRHFKQFLSGYSKLSSTGSSQRVYPSVLRRSIFGSPSLNSRKTWKVCHFCRLQGLDMGLNSVSEHSGYPSFDHYPLPVPFPGRFQHCHLYMFPFPTSTLYFTYGRSNRSNASPSFNGRLWFTARLGRE